MHLIICTHYLVPWMSLNLRELEQRVVWIHALDLFPGWSTPRPATHYDRTCHYKECRSQEKTVSNVILQGFHLGNHKRLINSTFPQEKEATWMDEYYENKLDSKILPPSQNKCR